MATYEGRLMRFAFTPELLVAICTKSEPRQGAVTRCTSGLPEGCLLERVYIDPTQRHQMIWVVVSHPSFDVIAEASEIPVLALEFQVIATPVPEVSA